MRDPRDTYPHLDKDGYESYFKDAQWIVPGIAILTCSECGAWVPPTEAEKHYNWHIQRPSHD